MTDENRPIDAEFSEDPGQTPTSGSQSGPGAGQTPGAGQAQASGHAAGPGGSTAGQAQGASGSSAGQAQGAASGFGPAQGGGSAPGALPPAPPVPPVPPPPPRGGDPEPEPEPEEEGRRGRRGRRHRKDRPPRKPRVFSTGRAIFGLIVIASGIIMLLASLGIHVGDVSKLIALGMIAFGILKVLGPQPASSKLFGSALILLGIFLMFDWWNLWPLLVILFGFHILWRAVGKKGVRQMGSTSSSADYAREFVVFGSSEKILKTQMFKGGEFTAIFGGVELDLRDAEIPEGQDAVIDCFVVFGGVELKVPEHWEVVNEASAVFGGVEEKSAAAANAAGGTRKLHIRGYVFFGGLEIRN